MGREGTKASVTVGGKPISKSRRTQRRPQHRFYLEGKWWEINPVMIAPVLPGETMQNLILQGRTVSAPVDSAVVGCWLEYYFFYVTHRQLLGATGADDYVNMVMDNTDVMAAGAAATHHYYNAKGHDWLTPIMDVVVREWFRRQGEAYNIAMSRTNRPMATVGIDSWMDSMYLEANRPAGTGGALGATQVAQEEARLAWEYMRQMGWTRASYEDWLATYGVDLNLTEGRDRPELLRFLRDWSYPTNVVDPATGAPSSAFSFGTVETANKRRYFTEPGFIVGLQVLRPKVYYGNQDSYAAAALDRAHRWLPAIMAGDPAVSIVTQGQAAGPLANTTQGNYVWDVRDLYLYGDQYVDAVSGSTQSNVIDLPIDATANHRYATEAIGNLLFVGTTDDSQRVFRTDGSIRLNIRGVQEDYT